LAVFESGNGIGIDEWGFTGFVEMESWCTALVRGEITRTEEEDVGNESIEGTMRDLDISDEERLSPFGIPVNTKAMAQTDLTHTI
jgi:hypothetical protein